MFDFFGMIRGEKCTGWAKLHENIGFPGVVADIFKNSVCNLRPVFQDHASAENRFLIYQLIFELQIIKNSFFRFLLQLRNFFLCTSRE